jgi:hypothetical protein
MMELDGDEMQKIELNGNIKEGDPKVNGLPFFYVLYIPHLHATSMFPKMAFGLASNLFHLCRIS